VCVFLCIFFLTIVNVATLFLLTDSAYQRPPSSTIQEIPCHCQNQIFCTVFSLPFVPVLIHMNPLQVVSPPLFFFYLNFDALFSSVLAIPSLFHPYFTNQQSVYAFLFFLMHGMCQDLHTILVFIILIKLSKG